MNLRKRLKTFFGLQSKTDQNQRSEAGKNYSSELKIISQKFILGAILTVYEDKQGNRYESQVKAIWLPNE
jgi:hypothetical protein